MARIALDLLSQRQQKEPDTMPKQSIPHGPIAALVAAIESARGVTLAPAKESRHAL